MRHLAASLALLAVAWIDVACTPKPEPSSGSAPAPTAEPAPSPSPSEVEATPDSSHPADPRERIAVEAGAAKAVGLPPLGFSLSLVGTGMSGAPLRDGDYLHLSGPPGGPLILRIAPAKLGAELRELVASADPSASATLVDAEVELLGERRPALAWVTGESLAQTAWCATIVAPATAKPGDPALLILAGVGGSKPDCAAVVGNPSLAKVLASLELEGS